MLLKLAGILSISWLTGALPFGVEVEDSIGPLGNFAACPISNANVTFPPGQTALSIPAGQVPNNIFLGSGVQNYTCSDSGNYTTAGAVAKLYDISCLFGTPEFDKIQDDCSAKSPTEKPFGPKSTAFFAVDHYFIPNPTGTGISPKFASARDGGASFVVATKVAGIPAPDPTNIDWLQLANSQGDLANTIFRVDTKGGRPPASCTPGSDPISVPYTAKYWFYV